MMYYSRDDISYLVQESSFSLSPSRLMPKTKGARDDAWGDGGEAEELDPPCS